MQSSLPAGWLAFTGRELNPLDRNKRFQITILVPLFWIYPGATYGGFSPVRLEGWPFRRGLPSTASSLSLLPAYAGHRTGLRPSFARLVTASLAPRCVGPDRFDCPPPVSVSTYPRG